MIKLRTLLLQNKLYVFLFILTLIYSIIFTNIKYESKYSLNNHKFIGIISKYHIDGNKLSFEFIGKEKLIGNYYFKTKKDLNNFKNNINLGDKLEFVGNLKSPKNNTIPNTFNYKKYLYNNKVYYILEVNEYKLLVKNNNIFYKLKNYILNTINNIKHNKYIYAFVLGETYYISDKVYESYSFNGVSHLFALSGTNVIVFALIINFLFKRNEFLRYLFLITFLLLFVFITNFSPSILRATVFFILVELNKTFYFYIKTINLLLLTFVILVLINPYLIYSLGFQLSYIITFFLILSNDLLKNNKYIINLFLVSLIAFLTSIPIIIYNFYYVNLLGIINNILFVPYVSIIIFPLSLLTFIFPFLAPLLHIFTNIMENLSIFLYKINIFTIYFPKLPLIFLFLYYSLLFILIKYKKIKTIFIIFLLLLLNFIYPYLDSNAYIHFIDVGQGDSTLITIPNKNKSILIDTGGKIVYKRDKWMKTEHNFLFVNSTLLPFLYSIGLKKIDYLILTHGDYDHMGEAINLIENFKVENVIFNCGEYNDLEKELIKVLEKKNIKYYSCIKELNIDEYKLQFLNTKEYDNENDNSNVIYLNYNNYKFLFMGDAGIDKEKDILEKYNLIDINFFKVGHHGSNTSSSELFINNINPKYSLISVGMNNRYGHPKNEVLDTLSNSKIYRTDLDGSIEIKLNKNGYKIRSCPP